MCARRDDCDGVSDCNDRFISGRHGDTQVLISKFVVNKSIENKIPQL